ncbi:MAG: hypothetical protein QM771_10975 [Nitrospira sp.]
MHPQVSLKLDELSGTEIEAGVKSGLLGIWASDSSQRHPTV